MRTALKENYVPYVIYSYQNYVCTHKLLCLGAWSQDKVYKMYKEYRKCIILNIVITLSRID